MILVNKTNRCVLLLVVSFLAACGGSAAPQPSATYQTDSGVLDTAQPAGSGSNTPELPAATVFTLATQSGSDTAVVTPTVDINCTETNPHPVGQSIAQTYHTSYEEVMTFFCTGVPFEDIVLGYQTAKAAGIEVEEALTLWYDLGSWEEVWIELGIQ